VPAGRRFGLRDRSLRGNGYFFGFHDKPPFSPCNRLLLAHP